MDKKLQELRTTKIEHGVVTDAQLVEAGAPASFPGLPVGPAPEHIKVCVTCEPEEKLWAKLPSFYVGDNFIRLIPFKDHMNIEAQAITKHANELAGYKITPKGMLQLYLKQEVPAEVLKKIFSETLER